VKKCQARFEILELRFEIWEKCQAEKRQAKIPPHDFHHVFIEKKRRIFSFLSGTICSHKFFQGF